ncbi:MAG: hypothetical protein A2846_00620 [Candidatus Doudnabacteria bacterium RIFCSPHIGHO2_01_FULL_49_9]|uniref:Uncharacterized protein n=1 Tax=Candidatus Doudnabacteria bacterium RIFCSPHIGHO2_01_FULL_49_9 TaxID=1817827 RepID=A0A1F5P0G9_9BACT|nr:MAG: hypothetical protein A2846_00620 [Candidatus Doudnabacteria bacterium RIFCSPHIGHO2_01_FULL_49_9]
MIGKTDVIAEQQLADRVEVPGWLLLSLDLARTIYQARGPCLIRQELEYVKVFYVLEVYLNNGRNASRTARLTGMSRKATRSCLRRARRFLSNE